MIGTGNQWNIRFFPTNLFQSVSQPFRDLMHQLSMQSPIRGNRFALLACKPPASDRKPSTSVAIPLMTYCPRRIPVRNPGIGIAGDERFHDGFIQPDHHSHGLHPLGNAFL